MLGYTLKIAVVIMVVFLAGCGSSTGNVKLAKLSEADISTMLVKGQTTPDEVKTYLGEPTESYTDEHGKKHWLYTHVKMKFKSSTYIPIVGLFNGGTNNTVKVLVIIFDKHDKLYSYRSELRHGETRIGLV